MKKIFNSYADHYDLFYKSKNYKKEAQFVLGILKSNKIYTGKLLDFGCGTGIHAISLSKNNFKVLGIDQSNEMIKIAKDKIKFNKLKNIDFKKGDINNIKLKDKFNSVISLFHVFSYQTHNNDVINFLKNANFHLKKNGLLIFDFWYGPGIIISKQINRQKKIKVKNELFVRTSSPTINYFENSVNVNIFVTKSSNKKKEVLTNENHNMRYFFVQELELFLNITGFKILNLHKSFKKNKPTNNDWTAMIIAKKIR